MMLGEIINRNTSVGYPSIFEFLDTLIGEECPARRKDGSQSHVGSVVNQFNEVVPNQWFTTKKQDNRHAVICQLIKQAFAFRSREFTRCSLGVCSRIAVITIEITLFRDVPDND
jgi:hypothetical protein